MLTGMASFVLCSEVRAFEDNAVEDAELYEWSEVFNNTALLWKQQEEVGLIDMHGATIRVLVYPELDCAQLFLDIPSMGVSFFPCVERSDSVATQ